MFDNKNNSFNNLDQTNNQNNPNISKEPISSPNLEPSPRGEIPQSTSNINPNENFSNQSSFNLNTFSVNPSPQPTSSPVPQPSQAPQSGLPPQVEISPQPMVTPQPEESIDNFLKTEPLSTTLTPEQPINEPKPPEVAPPQNDFSFINELNYVKTVQAQEINPYKDQSNVNSSILEQDITPKNCLKGNKKGNAFQVISITLVALILSSFIIATLIFNIRLLHISGTSMSPTITSKDWVISTAQKEYTYGDVVAFYHNEVIMIKRIIALPGDTVLIDVGGNVYVNDKLIDEPYIETKSLGDPEVDFPHTVHPESYFVLGDNREDSIDSRNISIRDIKSTDILGKVSYSLIPFKKVK